MKKTSYLNEKGFSLVEVLAVIAILGFIASIGLISISNVIAKSKDKTFVNNALTIIHAADLYLHDEKVADKDSLTQITYEDLYNFNYINEFYDPYTGEVLAPSDETYVEVTDGKITKVFLSGENRNLYSEIDNISVDLISMK
ncbi:prepilin-type N-terminal cleavage/methylation domain-containing protein [Neobacillus niacini]|uniref:type II secretion system protein n=1 Tax=Neobacillus driksii TaxID=3035913 RepID=UPI00277D321C|nr:type II secretion system protein [Neobacillus niacini]MDQ0975670.1 prepilin-type N-terminal cleavage/methylation domain-containing protein [Neobacillus niacini]